ncbi:MAG: hypothetical protein AAGB31_15925, partial [Bdellovibrio sp.]
MKTEIASLLATVFVASISFAQNTSTAKLSTEDNISSKGFRVGIVKPILKADIEVSSSYGSASGSSNLDEALGLSLGYASLPIQELGWTTNITYIDIANAGSSVGIARVDGNLAYAFTSVINLKGGLNLSKFISGDGHENIDTGVGAQGSLGVQLTKNFGLDLGYTHMRQSSSTGGFEVEITEAGFEIGLN